MTKKYDKKQRKQNQKKTTYGENHDPGGKKTMKTQKQSVYLFFRKRFWYIFPGLVFRFFVQEWREKRLYLTTLNEHEKKEIQKQRKRHLIAFSVSFLLHCIVFVSLFYDFMDPVLMGENELTAGETIDFDIMDGMISSNMDPVYDHNSEFIVKPSALIKKEDRKKISLNNLLQQLKTSKGPVLSDSPSRKNRQDHSKLHQEEQSLKSGLGWKGRVKQKKIKPLRLRLWDRMKLLKSRTTETQVNYGDIMKVIDKHNFQFQECYEKALLKDEKLSGKVIFLLKLNQSKVQKAGLELKGKGNPMSRRELTRCLFRESKRLSFKKNTENISIKFNLILFR